MFRTTTVTLFTLAFASLACASPALVPRGCSPTYSVDQTIYVRPPITDIAVYEWTPESYSIGAHITLQTRSVNDAFAQAEFSVLKQQNGLYTILPAFRTTVPIALTAGDDGDLAFGLAGLLSIPSQQFSIDCDVCPGEGSEPKCTIGHPATTQCVVGLESGETLRLGSCEEAGTYSLLGAITSA